MEIYFTNKKLKALVNDYRKMQKELGRNRANILNKRLQQIFFSETLEDLRHQPGNFHELKSNRKGQ